MVATATEARSVKDGPFRSKLRFRALNGAMIDVSMDLPVAADETGLALEIAREAIAQVAAALSEDPQLHPKHAVGPDETGALYWSWATPDAWRRTRS